MGITGRLNPITNFAANRVVLTLALLGRIGMFLGEYTYKIDDKKRLAIPVKFRKTLGKKAVMVTAQGVGKKPAGLIALNFPRLSKNILQI